jgi:hypothetical protein
VQLVDYWQISGMPLGDRQNEPSSSWNCYNASQLHCRQRIFTPSQAYALLKPAAAARTELRLPPQEHCGSVVLSRQARSSAKSAMRLFNDLCCMGMLVAFAWRTFSHCRR